ncbi:MAG: NTE family protein [Salibacteraceae bacterium]
MKNKIGLAMSGGGVKGAVHAGMIHFFDEIGFHPDMISGTSTGAIVGALYAAGKSGQEILEFFLNERPFSVSLWSGGLGLINTPVLKETLAKHIPKDSFEDLQIPLKITATDMLSGKSVTFNSGSLYNKVLASAAFPGVFNPIEIDGVLYSDGGILNNFPVDLIHPHCDKVIGMYLSPIKPLKRKEVSSTTDILSRTIDIQGSQAEYDKLKKCAIGICPKELVGYRTFDFNKETLHEMFQLGYTYIESHEKTIKGWMNLQ